MKYFEISLLCILSVLIFSCRSKDDNVFFKGELVHIGITSCTDTLKGSLVTLEDECLGLISVYDSLIFFSHAMDKKYQYRCYNYETGRHVANFFPIGRGNGEFMNVTPIHCTFNCGDTVKSIFVAVDEQKIGVFNISQSVLNKKTMLESISNFEWKKRFINPITQVYPLGDKIIGYINGRKPYFENDNYILPHCMVFDKTTMDVVDTIELYNKALLNELGEGIDINVFSFFNALKPDGTQMASIMVYLPQINIWDIKSGKIKGIRFGQTTLGDLMDHSRQATLCHAFLEVDENYIYVPLFIDDEFDKGTHLINVFSWEGNHIAQYYLEEPFDQIRMEPKSNTLFTYNQFTDKLYRYKMPDK